MLPLSRPERLFATLLLVIVPSSRLLCCLQISPTYNSRENNATMKKTFFDLTIYPKDVTESIGSVETSDLSLNKTIHVTKRQDKSKSDRKRSPGNELKIEWNGMEIFVPEVCYEKLKEVLESVSSSSLKLHPDVDDGNVTCYNITFDLIKMLQREEVKVERCSEQFSVAMLQFEERIKGISDIVLNRTSLHSFENQILDTAEKIVQDIQNWKRESLNTSTWTLNTRNENETLLACKDETAEVQRAFRNKVYQLALCVDQKRLIEQELLSNSSNCGDIEQLQQNLSKVGEELKDCNETKVNLEVELGVKEWDLKILINENRNLEESGTQTLKHYKNLLDFKDKLLNNLSLSREAAENCNKSLRAEKQEKERCVRDKMYLQTLLSNKTTYLESMLKNASHLQGGVNDRKILAERFLVYVTGLLTETRKLDDSLRKLNESTLSKHLQFENCLSENHKLWVETTSLGKLLKDCEEAEHESKEKASRTQEKLSQLEKNVTSLSDLKQALASCNATKQLLQNRNSEMTNQINETFVQRALLLINITTLKDMNSDLEKQNKLRTEESKSVNETANKLRQMLTEMENRLTEMQTQLEDLEKTMKLKENIIATAESDKRELMRELNKEKIKSTSANETANKMKEMLAGKENKLMEMQTQLEDIEKTMKLKENIIATAESDKRELMRELLKEKARLIACSRDKTNEKEELVLQLVSKNTSLGLCLKEMHEIRNNFQNYTEWCQNSSSIPNNVNISEAKEDLDTKQGKFEDCATEMQIMLESFAEQNMQLQNCTAEKLHLRETIEFKNREIENNLEIFARLNLTSKQALVTAMAKVTELQNEIQHLKLAVEEFREEIQLLVEQQAAQTMVCNGTLLNTDTGDVLNLQSTIDTSLRKILRKVRDHHSRVLTQLLQMKPSTQKVIPLRLRRLIQRGRTPEIALFGAAKEGNLTEAEVLLEVGADVNAQDREGMRALHWSALQGHSDLCELLLIQGADPDAHAPGWGSKTPLHLAAEHGHADTVEVLLDFGAKLESRAQDMATPLLYAAKYGKEQVVRVLLQRGADSHSTNIQNKTARDLAKQYPQIVALFDQFTKNKTR